MLGEQNADSYAREYLKCTESPQYFLDTYAFIVNPGEGKISFKLWEHQKVLLRELQENKLIVILKGRQLGVSWLIAGLALWEAMFHDGAVVLMISYRLEDAIILLDKVEHIYDNLPSWLQPRISKRNETTLQFKKRNSKITALPSTPDAGRGETASLVIVDEAASHPHARENFAAYKPTIDAGGKLVMVSTAKGRGNFFHLTWSNAPINNFHRIFLSAELRPGRDEAWFVQKQIECGDNNIFVQEYPRNSAEAFISTAGCFFNTETIHEYLQLCKRPIRTDMNDKLKIWQGPMNSRVYVAGVDVAEGLDAGNDKLDYSGLAIYDWQTCVHVADLHGHWSVDQFARHVNELCKTYNYPLLGVERNNHGHAVLLELQHLQYPNIYWHEDILETLRQGKKKMRKAGWPTNRKTKPIMEKTLNEMLESRAIMVYDEEFWDECLNYVEHGNGVNGAQQGTHDDRVVKHMIALQMRNAIGQVQTRQQGYVAGEWKISG